MIFDEKGNILNANRKFRDMLSYESEQIPHLQWESLTGTARRSDGGCDIVERAAADGSWRADLLSSTGQHVPVLIRAAALDASRHRFAVLFVNAAEMVRSEQDLRKLAGRVLHHYDSERRQIARELHDTTAQNLAALSMNLTMLETALDDRERTRRILSECQKLTEECLRETRAISYMLHPPLLDELGLESAVRAFFDMYRRRTGIEVTLQIPEAMSRLSPEIELGVFRVVQESLFNVHHHSGSPRAEVRLARKRSEIEVLVRDWGKGIDLTPSENLGIAGMRERVRLLGGRLEISRSDPGTLVRAVLPAES